ncbi:superoxide dismutase [Cu-Zn]-like isoform X2 [Cryptotermes secundus]|uniref:superoxide dismutase [Cu-Zn]-like isoform X2 n=1 Tax=Cryptotermes secundus TaxID=105785 RepID=UPI000CD7C8D1|nr:superoxide dismutase [Cu-Zn]-like isoform X2 [Cryptotermes secundus]
MSDYFVNRARVCIPKPPVTVEIKYEDLQPLMALAVLSGGSGDAEGGGCSGEILFTQPNFGAPVIVTGNVTGLSAGLHGIHVHLKGDMREGCESVGPHFNPYLHRHGAPQDFMRHVGDLGNIKAGDDGVAKVEFLDPIISLTGGLRSVMGRALVVHMGQDDFGRSHDEESIKTGNSGANICCGIIGCLN